MKLSSSRHNIHNPLGYVHRELLSLACSGVPMNPILFMLSVFGTIAVCLCFVLLLPAVGQTLAVLFGAVYTEKGAALVSRKPSGTDFRNPNDTSTWAE